MRMWLWVACLLLARVASAQPEVDALRVYLGTSGSTCTLHSGSGAPSGSLGAVCDVYVRTDSPYTVYAKTGASAWSETYRQGGTDVAVADGGTGLSSWTTGDLVYASGSTTLAGIADVGAGSLLGSNSGVPGWSASPTVSGTFTAQTSLSTPTLTHSTSLVISPTEDVVFNPTGNDILPQTGYDLNIGSLTTKYLTLHAAELWVETLVAQNTIATIGGRVLVGPTTTLAADLAPAGTTITVKHNQMANGDRVYMEADGKVEFMAITSAAGGSAGAYTYSVTRNLDGTGANQWYAGDAMFNTGTTGDGFIDLYSVSAVNGPSVLGPSIVGNVRTGTTYSDIAPRWAIGNLNGVFDYATDIYGAAFGDKDGPWAKIDATNGVRIGHDATTKIQLDASGYASFAEGAVTIDSTGISVDPYSAGAAWSSANAYRFDLSDSEAGLMAFDFALAGRTLLLHNNYSGSDTTNLNIIDIQAEDDSSGSGGSASAAITLRAQDTTSDYANITIAAGTPASSSVCVTGSSCISLHNSEHVWLDTAKTYFSGEIIFNTDVSSPSEGSITENATNGLSMRVKTGSSYDFAITDQPNTSYIMRVPTGTAELYIGGVGGDGTGKVVCIKSDTTLGTCTDQPNGSGICTCS